MIFSGQLSVPARATLVCTMYSRKSSPRCIHAVTKRAILYCSAFCLKRSSYRASECRVAWNISLRDNVVRQSRILVSPPLLLAFLQSVKFHFRPSRGGPSGIPRSETSGGYFFCDFTLASVAPVAPRYVEKKKRESMAPAISFVAGNISARRQYFGYR